MLQQTRTGKAKFPERLFWMLESAVHNRFNDIVSWTEDGEAFVVRNLDLFEKQVVPRFFDHSSIRSFTRQLSYWSIRRVAKSKNSLTFQHPFLRKGQRSLIQSIKRKENKGNRVKQNGVTINLKQCKDDDSMARLLSILRKCQTPRSKTVMSLLSPQSRGGSGNTLLEQLNVALQKGDITSSRQQETLKQLVTELKFSTTLKEQQETNEARKEKSAIIALNAPVLVEESTSDAFKCDCKCEETIECSRYNVIGRAPQLLEPKTAPTFQSKNSDPTSKLYIENLSEEVELVSLANFGNDDYITSDFAETGWVPRLAPRPSRENTGTDDAVAVPEMQCNINMVWPKILPENDNLAPVLLPDSFPLFDYDHCHENDGARSDNFSGFAQV